MDLYAKEGLRTLLFAQRRLTLKEYDSWEREYKNASLGLSNREANMDRVAELLERDFEIVGSTAIEDRL
jgi:magnesium-transporting ATPase (P-type)